MFRALRIVAPAIAFFLLSFGSSAQECTLGARVEASATIQRMSVIRSEMLGLFEVSKFDCGIGRIVAKYHSGSGNFKVGVTINFSGIVRRGKFVSDDLEFYIDAEKSLCL